MRKMIPNGCKNDSNVRWQLPLTLTLSFNELIMMLNCYIMDELLTQGYQECRSLDPELSWCLFMEPFVGKMIMFWDVNGIGIPRRTESNSALWRVILSQTISKYSVLGTIKTAVCIITAPDVIFREINLHLWCSYGSSVQAESIYFSFPRDYY